jgi:predicted metalloprotease with PDZ domain
MWWMEGVTLHYADVLLRRAGIPTARPSRREQLERDIGEYLDNPGDALVSLEQAGSWSGDRPGTHGNVQPDYYLQGRLVGAMLDLVVREATGNQHSLDDVMRRLYIRDAGHGYTGADIQYAAEATCSCALDAFFEVNVRRAGTIDFDRHLHAAGLRAAVSTSPAVDDAGRPRADARVWAWVPPGETAPRLIVTQPDGAWAAAGLNSGDRIVSWNGAPLDGMRDFRTRLGALQPGESLTLSYERAGTVHQATFRLAGYTEHRVRLETLPNTTDRQRAVAEAAMLASHDDVSRR